VDVGGVLEDPARGSGVAVIAVDAAGKNQIVVIPGANGAFAPDALLLHRAALTAADLVLLQLEIPVPTVLAAARIAHAAGATVVLDPAPAQPIPAELLPLCHFVTPNQTELGRLTGLDEAKFTGPGGLAGVDGAAGRLLAAGAGRILVKLGGAGARLVTPAGARSWPSFPVRPVDTTAAGDTFNAALAVGLAEGLAEPDLARLACASAALSVTRPGAQPSVPSRAEVAAFLATRGALGVASP
jgi:ribokinase